MEFSAFFKPHRIKPIPEYQSLQNLFCVQGFRILYCLMRLKLPILFLHRKTTVSTMVSFQKPPSIQEVSPLLRYISVQPNAPKKEFRRSYLSQLSYLIFSIMLFCSAFSLSFLIKQPPPPPKKKKKRGNYYYSNVK